MATTTAMGRCVFALGAFATTAIVHYGSSTKKSLAANPDVSNASSTSSVVPHLHVLAATGTDANLTAGPNPNTSKTSKQDATAVEETTTSRTGAAERDRVLQFPGCVSCQESPFDQFAGYLDVSSTRHIFYVYVESQANPSNDPLILWTNGGPGCSGLYGFGTEHGPYLILEPGEPVDEDSLRLDPDALKLTFNPHSWNKVANVLYIEQPAGVGFSYADTSHDLSTGDSKAAEDNYRLIKEFYKRFPERQGNPLIIASESYGGHYMPQLALKILDEDKEGSLNLSGMMVGNPFVDPYSNSMAMVQAFYSHGFLPQPLFDQWSIRCQGEDKYRTEDCMRVEMQIFAIVQPGVNYYGLDYDICLSKASASDAQEVESDVSIVSTLLRRSENRRLQGTSHSRARNASHATQCDAIHSIMARRLLDDGASDPSDSGASQTSFIMPNTNEVFRPCSEVLVEEYLSRSDVQTAVHVHNGNKSAGPIQWRRCGNSLRYSTQDRYASVIDLYESLIQQAAAAGQHLKILIFSGDDDAVCPTAGTQAWIWKLNGAVPFDPVWKPWMVQSSLGDNNLEGQIGGFVTHFDLGSQTNSTLTFSTVRKAGHEVAFYQPKAALTMLTNYLKGKW